MAGCATDQLKQIAENMCLLTGTPVNECMYMMLNIINFREVEPIVSNKLTNEERAKLRMAQDFARFNPITHDDALKIIDFIQANHEAILRGFKLGSRLFLAFEESVPSLMQTNANLNKRLNKKSEEISRLNSATQRQKERIAELEELVGHLQITQNELRKMLSEEVKAIEGANRNRKVNCYCQKCMDKREDKRAGASFDIINDCGEVTTIIVMHDTSK